MKYPRCRRMWGHYFVGFTRCTRRRWHRGEHWFNESEVVDP